MDTATVDGVELEYETVGSGEPVLLIAPVLADGMAPLVGEAALADRHQLIRYHKRGWAGSTPTDGPVSIADHAADAAELLRHLGVERTHVVGHSSGADVAAQLAIDIPEVVQSLVLLEATFFSVPIGPGFLDGAAPVLEAYGGGDHEGAVAMFLSAVSGLDWDICRELLEDRMPGSVASAVKDADTFFGVELPAVIGWEFGAEQAAAITAPVLSVVGADTGPLWLEVAERIRTSVPVVEECTIEGVGHLLHIQQPAPVARAIADFFERHPIAAA